MNDNYISKSVSPLDSSSASLSASSPELTPLMKQYTEIKDLYPDSILFFRMGDFYEMFGEDAVTASKVLQITLTTRDKNKTNPIPMCGVPYYTLDAYVKKMVGAGYKAAICDQIEDPADAKGIVAREVTRVVTPGTFEPDNPKENVFVFAFIPAGDTHGVALADTTTGEFVVYESKESIYDEINRSGAREILCPASIKKDIHYSIALKNYFVTYYDDYCFDYAEALKLLLDFFKVSTLEGFGIGESQPLVSAAGALLSYLLETQKSGLSFERLRPLNSSQFMFLDATAVRNMELVKNLKDLSEEGTLLRVIDETLTPMGGRFLREALLKPLIDAGTIEMRLNAVDNLYYDYGLREDIRVALKNVQDLERLLSRVVKGSASPRDLIAIKDSVENIPSLGALAGKSEDGYLQSLAVHLGDFSSLVRVIGDTVMDTPPPTAREGWVIKDGVNEEIDELREISTKGKSFLAELEAKERTSTGINNLKVSFNKVFGYYIEVTKSNLHLVPPRFIRKQTLVNAERFITQELKNYENKIIGAEEKLKNLEYQCFKELVEKTGYYAGDIRRATRAVAQVDFIQCAAHVARKNNYLKPAVYSGNVIEIRDGRHPVIERIAGFGKFIPNDTYLDLDNDKMLVITGPNMAGKSTYMRQTALIVLMAQMGFFVPAESAKIGVADRIFTRIGASDYLSHGQSTFMVEMIETSNIVNNATSKSLIILDEVGRGTSTFDGISIAWAVAEHIATSVAARTLFATHYNELTELTLSTPGVKNYNVSVKEWGDEIIFLRKIVKGPADKSYGIQVARLAGLPDGIIERAKEILANLEKKEFDENQEPRITLRKKKKPAEQLELFAPVANKEALPVISRLTRLDVDSLSAEDALKELKGLKGLL